VAVRRHEEIAGFISSSFPSIWSLEILLYLKERSWATVPTQQIKTEMRASDSVVAASLASLIAAGLIVEEEEQAYRYCPVNEDLSRLVGATEALYRTRPDAVRRVIVLGTGSLAAFADAFKLRGD
jgi:hypothetical protein